MRFGGGGGGGGMRFNGGGSSFRSGGAGFRSGGNFAPRSFSSGNSFRSFSPGINSGSSNRGFAGRSNFNSGFGQRSMNNSAPRLGLRGGSVLGNANVGGRNFNGAWNSGFRNGGLNGGFRNGGLNSGFRVGGINNNFRNGGYGFRNNGFGNNWYRGNWNAGWNNRPWGWGRGYYGFGRPWGWGFGSGLLTGLVLGGGYGGWGYGGYGYGGYGNWGYSGYSNPYYDAGYYPSYIDYSQPIGYGQDPSVYGQDPNQVATVQGGSAPQQQPQSNVDPVAQQQFDAARQAFYEGRYDDALTSLDAALAKMPNDAALHELRGLTLFATGKYPQAAATAYAVLSVGPGWDWATLASLYSDVNVYTQQFRALERYRNANPTAADGHFLTGYHYLATGAKPAAATEFAAAARLNSKDELSRQIVASLTGKPVERPTTPTTTGSPITTTPPATTLPPVTTPPAAGLNGQDTPTNVPLPVAPPTSGGAVVTPVQPANPEVGAVKPVVTVDSVMGDWKASRDDGSAFQLKLTPDNRFVWKFTPKDGKVQELTGTFTVADGFLILKQNENSALVGAVKPRAEGFNFKLIGDNPSDTGLNFGK